MPRVRCPKCNNIEGILKAGIVRYKQRYYRKKCDYHFIIVRRQTDIGLVSSHTTTQVLEKYYLDPKVLTAVEISALKVRVFGKK